MIEERLDESEVYQIRKQKLKELREQGFNYPNQFKPLHSTKEILEQYSDLSKEELNEKKIHVKIAGRIILRRLMGKASFFHLQDGKGKLQVYLRENEIPESYEQFKRWDLGDFVGWKAIYLSPIRVN